MSIVAPPVSGRASEEANTIAHKQSRVAMVLCMAIYTVAIFLMLHASMRIAGGHFYYALDDTYISMAMAKSIAVHGVWGVTQYAFSSSTSTPLYLLLLAGVYRIFGVSEWAPLALSWVFGLGCVYAASRIVVNHVAREWRLPTLLAVMFLSPLFALGLLGMEHTLHILLTLLFLDQLADERASPWPLALISFLMTATRYEGMLIAGAAVALLLTTRRLAAAITIATATAAPILIYGVFSILHGGYWLPNSVALKGIRLHGSSMGSWWHLLVAKGASDIMGAPHLFFLFTGLLFATIALRNQNRAAAMMARVIVLAGLLHLMAADVGWGYRYEAYLVVAGIVAGFSLLSSRGSNRSAMARIAIAWLCFAGVLLLNQSLQSITRMDRYARAIYLQQIQMANFLHSYFPHAAIAANDIGAINFFNDLHCVDLAGLGDDRVFAAKHNHSYTTAALAEITSTSNVQIALVYDNWFMAQPKAYMHGPPLPATWILVGQWTRPKDPLVQLGETTVSFYAVDSASAGPLRNALLQFDRVLPDGTSSTVSK